MKTRIFCRFMPVFFLLASALVLQNCSFDDDNQQKSFLVGTWRYQFADGYVSWTFKADGTGSFYEWDDGEVEESDTFTYSIDEANERIAFYFTNRGNEMVKYSKKSNKKIIVYDFFDAVEEWNKQ